ncbi:MAG: type III-B CRISPR module-associated protein Cmr3 [Pseudomonadales bacterium]|nr:type III-B CRISPR module-associated protein Cmr3 [Pseudomonadales bacterium]
MHNYLIEPLAPLVFRSGKPFAAASGADGSNFPLPSSSAGLLRTVSADQQQIPFNDSLKQQACKGPLLVSYETPDKLTILVPKPADAMYFKAKDGSQKLVRLSPKAFDASTEGECGSDLPQGLLPVQMEESLKGKPATGAQFWSLTDLIAWQSGKKLDITSIEKNGLKNLPSEHRTHVALNDSTLASDDGRLFQTSGLALQAAKNNSTWDNKQLGFWLQSEQKLKQDLVTFGGEKRLSRLQHLASMPPDSTPNTQLSAQVRHAKGLRLTLLTPAIFGKGYLPQWLNDNLEGNPPFCPQLQLKLKAVAIERWLAVSGWDLAQWKPKAMRKAVAAGAVYWFEVMGDVPDNLHQTLWLQSIADNEQDQRDGFGLILPAAWPAV